MEVLKNSERSSNPYEKASFVSKFFLCYVNPVFKKGYKGTILKKDVPRIAQEDSAKHQAQILEKAWSDELRKQKKSQSLFQVVAKRGFIPIFLFFFAHFIAIGVRIGQAICLRKLLENLESNPTNSDQIYWASGIVISLFLPWLFLHAVAYNAERNGVNCKSAILAMIYKKVSGLSICFKRC